MKITATAESIDTLCHECLALGFFSDEQPPQGYAGNADWRLNSAISRLMAQGVLTGNFMEKTLLSSGHRIPASKILLIGLGKSKELTYDRLHRVGQAIAKTLQGIHCDDLALEIPGLGRCKLEGSKMALAVTEGFYEFFEKDSNGSTPPGSFSVLGNSKHLDELILGMHEFKVNIKARTHVDVIERGNKDGHL